MGSCSICGKTVEYPGSTQHFKKHRREFAEQTRYGKYTSKDIIQAYYGSDEASKWAEKMVENLREAGYMNRPDKTSLTDFEEEEE